MLTCSKCGHHDQIEHVTTRWGNEIHCHFCGNVAIEGVKARWPIVEKAVKIDASTGKPIKPIGSKIVIYGREYEVVDHVRYYHGGETALLDKVEQEPAIIESPSNDNQEENMATKPLCSVEGCTKTAHVKGVCDRHYREKFGHSYKPESKRGQKKAEPKAPTLADKVEQWKAEQKAMRVEAEKKTPPTVDCKTCMEIMEMDRHMLNNPFLLHITLDPELLDELTKKAKAEYRNPEQQAAYYIDRALKKDSYSL
jgi:hypothetical protein